MTNQVNNEYLATLYHVQDLSSNTTYGFYARIGDADRVANADPANRVVTEIEFLSFRNAIWNLRIAPFTNFDLEGNSLSDTVIRNLWDALVEFGSPVVQRFNEMTEGNDWNDDILLTHYRYQLAGMDFSDGNEAQFNDRQLHALVYIVSGGNYSAALNFADGGVA